MAERKLTESQLTHRARMEAPPADVMPYAVFCNEASVEIKYSSEYTWAAMQAAALEWAARPEGSRLLRRAHEELLRVPEAARVEIMRRTLAASGVTDKLLQEGGYLTGWTSYIRQRFQGAVRRAFRAKMEWPKTDRWVVPSTDPDFGPVAVTAHVTYSHRVMIDGVEHSVDGLLAKMREVEDCPEDRGFASMHGGGEDTVVAEMLERRAGLTCRGGYHSSPTYESDKWSHFRRQLEALKEVR